MKAMKLLYFILLLFLVGCEGSSESKTIAVEEFTPPKLEATWSGEFSTWWELPQYYNGVPKYSGAFGTYTHKHIPMAVANKGDLYSIRTDNTEDNNFYVYAMKNGVSVLVHTTYNWSDPHTNGVIYLDSYGYVWVRIASRGLAHKFQSGKVLKSDTPYELDFSCIEGCSSVESNYEAYPQMHNTSWGDHLVYTKYDQIDNQGMNYRNLYSRLGDEHIKLSKFAHYNVSYYDSNRDELCIASNTLIGGSPENRVNLSVICTEGGQELWKLSDNTLLKLDDPLDPFEFNRVVHDTQITGTFVYLKDIIAYAGRLRVLFTETDSSDPTKGTRYLKEWIQGVGVKTITKVGHNYSAGAYIKKDSKLFIVSGGSAVPYYLSGYLTLYDEDYNVIDELSDNNEYSYVRRVRYGDGQAVMSKGQSSVKSRGEYYYLTLR